MMHHSLPHQSNKHIILSYPLIIITILIVLIILSSLLTLWTINEMIWITHHKWFKRMNDEIGPIDYQQTQSIQYISYNHFDITILQDICYSVEWIDQENQHLNHYQSINYTWTIQLIHILECIFIHLNPFFSECWNV